MKIYTKEGDAGKTSLLHGTRVPKNNERIEAYGTLDELNTLIGLFNDQSRAEAREIPLLENIQQNLFSMGALIANEKPTEEDITKFSIREDEIEALEMAIDEMSNDVPPLNHFILPGGYPLVSICHICRTVTRRAERRMADIADSIPVESLYFPYINRLSDYFFALARWLNYSVQGTEKIWKPL